MAPIDLINETDASNQESTSDLSKLPLRPNAGNNNLLLMVNNHDQVSKIDEEDRIDEEDMIEASSASSTTESSFSSSSLSPLSDFNSSQKTRTIDVDEEEMQMLNSKLSTNNEEINYSPDSPTPTPTPNETKPNLEEKFNTFYTNNKKSDLLTNSLPPLPTTLPLKTNLNSTTSLKSQPVIGLATYPPMMNQATPLQQNPAYVSYLPSPKPVANTPHNIQLDVANSNSKVQTPSTLYVHVATGHIFNLQLGDKIREVFGPATVKIDSPQPLQLSQPAQDQFVQSIVDENGMLAHLIISSQQQNQMVHPGLTVQTNETILNNMNSNNNLQQSNNQLANSAKQMINQSTNNKNFIENYSNLSQNKNLTSSTAQMQTYCSYQLPSQIHTVPNTLNYPQHSIQPVHTIPNHQQFTNNLNPYYPTGNSSHHFSHHNNNTNQHIHQSHLPHYHHIPQSHSSSFQNHYNYIKTQSPAQPEAVLSSEDIHTKQDGSTIAENTSTASSYDLDDNSSTSKQSDSEIIISEALVNANSTKNNNHNSLSVSPLSSSSCSSTTPSLANSTSSSYSASFSSSKQIDESLHNNNVYINGSNELYLSQKAKKNNLRLATSNSNSNLGTSNQQDLDNLSNNRLKETKIFQNSTKKLPTPLGNNFSNLSNKISNQSGSVLYNYHTNNSSTLSTTDFIPNQPHPSRTIYNTNRTFVNTTTAITNKQFQTTNKKQFNFVTNNNNNNTNKNTNNHTKMDHSTIKASQDEAGTSKPQIEIKSQDLDVEIDKNFELYQSILSKLKKPIVSNIESQSVLVFLSPIELDSCETSSLVLTPDIIHKFQNLNYTLELMCDTQHFNKVYTGDANEITLKDLKPNTKYYLRVFASLSSKCRGDYTSAVSFLTKPSQPDQPVPPKLAGLRKKNELTLKWTNSNDNGSKILNFILEYQEVINADKQEELELENKINMSNYIQVYKGALKQFIVKKLSPSTCYAFRLGAENSFGLSEFSRPALIYTAGCVPNTPDSPRLVEATMSGLTLAWGPKRPNETDYELQMLDSDDKTAASYGFLTVFNGPQLVHTINDLKRCCSYQFRLRAKNEEGSSAWSETERFTTKADIPKCPCKLKVKIQSLIVYKISWEAPKDDGGDTIKRYTLEMSEFDQNLYEEIYNGEETDFQLDKTLKPGYSYLLRVYCSNSIGSSEYSDVVTFITQPIIPGKPLPPKLASKPKSSSVQLKWSYPDNDGGSSIINYEVKLQNDDEYSAYKGNDFTIVINNLQPGRNYTVKMRSINKVGPSEWSDLLEFTSGAGSPDPPDIASIVAKSSNCLLVNWTEPSSNGSPIIEYRLEWSLKDSDTFSLVYSGNNLKYELKNCFQPSTRYLFKVQATNLNGPSSYSQCAEYLTPASVPSIVSGIKIEESNSDSILVTWKQPNSNGSPIQFYNIDFSDLTTNTSNSNPYIVLHQHECEYRFDQLQPDTNYKFRVQAANCVGIGQFSNLVKFKTKALAPMPPSIDLVSTSYNSVKLKWSALNNNNNNQDISLSIINPANNKIALNEYQIVYNLEMMLDMRNDDFDQSETSFISVYKGPLSVFKVTKLKESSVYIFRISAQNEAGQGKWSDLYKFSTTKSPPIISKAPIVSELSQNSSLIEWQTAKLSLSSSSPLNDQLEDMAQKPDSLEYCLQLQLVKKDSDYREVYRGEMCSYRLNNLDPNTEYNVRVCAVRICHNEQTVQRICSPSSPHTSFLTLKVNKSNVGNQLKVDLGGSGQIGSVSSVRQMSLWERFMWPSFFMSINRSKLHEKSALSNASSRISKKSASNRTSLTSVAQSTIATNNSNQAVEHALNDSKSISRRKSDQYWAFSLIFILVLIAFLIAYLVSSFYEVASVQNSEF